MDLFSFLQIDSAFSTFGLAPFYSPPRFHVSLLWTLGDQVDKAEKKLLKSDFCDKEWLDLGTATEFKLKTGNKVFSLPLKKI